MQYCIRCGKMEKVYSDFRGEYHLQDDLNACKGPFTSCPPPEFEEEWQDHLPPISVEELIEDNILSLYPNLQ